MNTIDTLINELLDDVEGEFVTMQLAEKLITTLNSDHPDVLHAWLVERASKIMAVAINDRLRQRRQRSRHQMQAGAFAEAARRYADGVTDAFDVIESPFSAVYVVGESSDGPVRRSVADMTGSDHQFVANQYQENGKRDLMLAAFHRTIAKALGKKRTADAMDEAKYQQTYEATYRRLMNADPSTA